jgi:hypothetical protein
MLVTLIVAVVPVEFSKPRGADTPVAVVHAERRPFLAVQNW